MKNMERLKKKFYNAKQYMPAPVMHPVEGATVGILAYGSTENAVLEAQHYLAKDDGIKADFMRIRAIPFTDEVIQFIEKYDQIFVVEMNRDAQMQQILITEYPQYAMKFKSVAYHDGLPAAAKWVREGILAVYEKAVVSKPKAAVRPKAKKAVAVQARVSTAKKTVIQSKPAAKSKRK
jgi:2-oxoglutarate ferredoxin oxidoreductase subunit alpha